MKLDEFQFDLPKELIAYEQIEPRDSSKMLIVKNGKFIDSEFVHFLDYVTENDLLIFNDTKVLKANLDCYLGEKKFRINLLEQISDKTWTCFAKKTSKLQIGDRLFINEQFSFVVEAIDAGKLTIKFDQDDVFYLIDLYGKMPIPPYIKREATKDDEKKYQNVFAQKIGAVAAPTAGLHFSQASFDEIKKRGINYKFVTLHVGAGTFLPVKVEDITQHKMHYEYYEISSDTMKAIQKTKQNNGKIITIGTTVLRALETAANSEKENIEYKGKTDIFIYPGYKFKLVDMLLTNFHLSGSSLFMLVSAFSGLENMKKAYKHAIEKKYRFFSFGDCCLLSRKNDKV